MGVLQPTCAWDADRSFLQKISADGRGNPHEANPHEVKPWLNPGFVGIYIQGDHQTPGCLRWCRILAVHSRYYVSQLGLKGIITAMFICSRGWA